jgi:hypothetical protein
VLLSVIAWFALWKLRPTTDSLASRLMGSYLWIFRVQARAAISQRMIGADGFRSR